MIRQKQKWQLRKKVNGFYISTINLINANRYLHIRTFSETFNNFNFHRVMKLFRRSGTWETMVLDLENENWIEQVRNKYKHRALQTHEEMIKKYANFRRDNSQEEQP